MENEIWKDIYFVDKGIIYDYRELYQISNYGRIRSLNYNHTKKTKLLCPTKTKKGYMKVHLDKKGKRKYFLIHKLVAMMFIENPKNLPYVLHKIPVSRGGTNEISNLYWGTHSDNMKDKVKDGNFRNPRLGRFGIKNPTCKQILQYNKENFLIKEWESILKASKTLNINLSNIILCCQGKRKTAGGFIWKYKEEL